MPKIGNGEKYKFHIVNQFGYGVDHADPLARATEQPPLTASVVNESQFKFDDDQWMENRISQASWKKPVSIYEIHLGSWRPGLGYREVAPYLIAYLKQTGFTHVEFMPLTEHPFGGSWGYQVTSFFAPTSRYGTPDDLKYLINELHKNGFGAILDWVPAHFPKDEWALAKFDGTSLYEHEDPRQGEHPDWGTLIFNFERNEVRNFLVSSAVYWLTQFHFDGIRVDAVASMLYLDYSRQDGQWLPNKYGGRENLGAIEFLKELNATAYRLAPGITMYAEESTAWPGVTAATEHGGLGFGFKWNMGWMHDTLEYFKLDPIYRNYHHGEITNSLNYAFTENYVLPLSHDEVVHGKGSLISRATGNEFDQRAALRALYGYMWVYPGKKLLFMGSEFGQRTEWREAFGIDFHLLENPGHKGILDLVCELNKHYQNSPELYELETNGQSFQWLRGDDAQSNVVSFARIDDNENMILGITNFSASHHGEYKLPLPKPGTWKVLLNTDNSEYGGSGIYVPNVDSVESIDGEFYSRMQFGYLNLPPLTTIWLKLAQ